jgi:hypothetical protein
MFGSTYVCEWLFSIMQRNKAHERLWLTDTRLSMVTKVISAQDLKSKIHTLAANKRCQISWKKIQGKFSYFKNSLFFFL